MGNKIRWYWWVIGLVVLAGIGFGTWWYVTDILPERGVVDDSLNRPTGRLDGLDTATNLSSVEWAFMGDRWQAMGSAPDCPEPLELRAPVDLSRVTAMLYPGQSRGDDYKPHGGFRFADNTNNEVAIMAPLEGQLVRGSRYIEQGETQYLLEFVNSCGIAYRFDHLLTLAPAMQVAVEAFPAPALGDSRTSNVNPPIAVEQGDTISTAVGFATTGNTTVDFGVYNLRQTNGATGLPVDDQQLAPYGVCWFNLMSSADEATIRALPAGDTESGSTSSYCQ